MDNELIRWASGETPAPRRSREAAREAQRIFDEVRVAGLQMDGASALAAHAMGALDALDAERRALPSNRDPNLALMMLEFESVAFIQMKRAQGRPFDQFKL